MHLAAPALAQGPVPSSPPSWAQRLQAELALAAGQHSAAVGVYVRDLDSGEAVSHGGDERWYLASLVKVPVAITVLQGVERGSFTLDTKLRLRADDYVDGAGPTNARPVGAALSVRSLLEQMIIHSDNTASDMLIGLVGIRAVNALVEQLAAHGLERITTLADVRRLAYSKLTPEATHLSGRDFLVLKQQRSDDERLQALSRILRVPMSDFQHPTLSDAFEAYYASGANSGRLDAYADLLQQLVEGRVLNATHTQYLLGVMERVQTGAQRIKAGLPPHARFAHKTGTQRARTCDAGVISVAHTGQVHRRVIVVACTRGEMLTTRSDRALRDVGTALCKSGLLTGGKLHDPLCTAAAHAVPSSSPVGR